MVLTLSGCDKHLRWTQMDSHLQFLKFRVTLRTTKDGRLLREIVELLSSILAKRTLSLTPILSSLSPDEIGIVLVNGNGCPYGK
jgi:hypothetical protein